MCRSIPGIREAAVGVVDATIELLVEFVSRGCRCGIATGPESRDEVFPSAHRLQRSVIHHFLRRDDVANLLMPLIIVVPSQAALVFPACVVTCEFASEEAPAWPLSAANHHSVKMPSAAASRPHRARSIHSAPAISYSWLAWPDIRLPAIRASGTGPIGFAADRASRSAGEWQRVVRCDRLERTTVWPARVPD